MQITVYSGTGGTTILTRVLDVDTATINKDGSVSYTGEMENPDGQRIISLAPSINRIVIEREGNE